MPRDSYREAVQKKSVQAIEDWYIRRGYSGQRLRKAVVADANIQKLLAKKRSKATKRAVLWPGESKRYVIASDIDNEIIDLIHNIEESGRFTKEELFLVHLIRTQLEPTWRDPLLKLLRALWKARDKSLKVRRQAMLSVARRWWYPKKVKQ